MFSFLTPQGSILEPLLFMLNVNNLPEATSKCNIYMYTCDTVLFYASLKASG